MVRSILPTGERHTEKVRKQLKAIEKAFVTQEKGIIHERRLCWLTPEPWLCEARKGRVS